MAEPHEIDTTGNARTAISRAEAINEANAWLVGGGVLTMALWPLALPILILTLVATIPLVLLALIPALAIALVAAPVLAVRTILQRLGSGRAAAGDQLDAPLYRDWSNRTGSA